MKLFRTFYSHRVGNRTVTHSCRIPANSPRTAERIVKAWLSIRGIDPYSITADA